MEETPKYYRVVVVDGPDSGLTFADCLVKKGIDFMKLKSPAESAADLGPLFFYPDGAQILDQLGIPETLMNERESLKNIFFQSTCGKLIAVNDIFVELRERHGGLVLFGEEATMDLIRNLKIPLPSSNPPPTEKEVLFPACLINMVTSEMWTNGFVKESKRFVANVMQSIQQKVTETDDENAVNAGAFWLSNVHQMLSFVFMAEDQYEVGETGDYGYNRLLEIVKHDLESLESNIYHTWMKVLKRSLYRMIVPAIVESQSLPGFVTSETNRFLGKLLPPTNHPVYSMETLLSFLSRVYRAMQAFYLEDTTIMQTFTELLRLVGVTAFNDLLMRQNFCSWKRGLQINYNITRIEEWCTSHDMPEVTLQLEHLIQATKLLQLKKATLNDIEIIQNICWKLSPSQIQNFLNQYLVASYEQPINREIMKTVASQNT
ncbi:Myosin type-2 heavy chain 1 variant 2 [Penicillium atrosanguineum]|uniref:Myosin type-2 heavy chain 1 variant 2 n=1 Tax=Penicillium atrosanguineum TaxID=1132637 RepID=A0A9W9PYW9_9EURO|nr:Myosin type-2 heavy chain 1 variant 2 [Penicillium atrosanguineum]